MLWVFSVYYLFLHDSQKKLMKKIWPRLGQRNEIIYPSPVDVRKTNNSEQWWKKKKKAALTKSRFDCCGTILTFQDTIPLPDESWFLSSVPLMREATVCVCVCVCKPQRVLAGTDGTILWYLPHVSGFYREPETRWALGLEFYQFDKPATQLPNIHHSAKVISI